MNTYSIYLNDKEIVSVEGVEFAHEVYTKTKELAELLNVCCSLLWYDGTTKHSLYYNPED